MIGKGLGVGDEEEEEEEEEEKEEDGSLFPCSFVPTCALRCIIQLSSPLVFAALSFHVNSQSLLLRLTVA